MPEIAVQTDENEMNYINDANLIASNGVLAVQTGSQETETETKREMECLPLTMQEMTLHNPTAAAIVNTPQQFLVVPMPSQEIERLGQRFAQSMDRLENSILGLTEAAHELKHSVHGLRQDVRGLRQATEENTRGCFARFGAL